MKTKIAAYVGGIFLLLVSSAHVNAQQTTLSVKHIYNYPDTAYEGVFYNLLINVQNTDSNLFTGTIDIISQNTDTTLQHDTLAQSQTFTLINFGDTINLSSQSFQFKASHYKAGINIVVVWPRLSNGTIIASDSLVDSVYFVPLSGVHGENSKNKELFLFPNPAKDFIYVVNRDQSIFEYVRIFDSNGALISSIDNPSAKINIKSLTEGLYLIEIKRKNHSPVYRKFIKQRE